MPVPPDDAPGEVPAPSAPADGEIQPVGVPREPGVYENGPPIVVAPEDVPRRAWWRTRAARVAVVTAGVLLLGAASYFTYQLDSASRQLRRERDANDELRRDGDDLRNSLADAETTAATAAAQKQEIERSLRDAAEVRGGHLVTSQLMRVASLYKDDPLQAMALLHDYEMFPIDRRDAAWHYYANACHRRLTPEHVGTVVETGFPGPHRDAGGRLPALVETPDRKLRVVDLATGDVLFTPHPILEAYLDNLSAITAGGRTAMVWSDSRAAPGSDPERRAHHFRFLDLETGGWHKLRLNGLHGVRVWLTPDGRGCFVMTDTERTLHDVATGEVVRKEPIPRDTFDDRGPVAFSPDGRHLALTARREAGGPEVRIIDARANTGVRAIVPDLRIWFEGKVTAVTHPGTELSVELMQFSPDGRSLAVLYAFKHDEDDRAARALACCVASVETGRLVGWTQPVPSDFMATLAFSPDGQTLAIGYDPRGRSRPQEGVRVYRTAGERSFLLPLVTFPYPSPPAHPLLRDVWGTDWGAVRGLSFTPDGSRLVIGVATQGGQYVVEGDVGSGRSRLLAGLMPLWSPLHMHAHVSRRNELLVVTTEKHLHRWRLAPDDAAATLPHAPPRSGLRLSPENGFEVGFTNNDDRFFARYEYWHDDEEGVADPPAELFKIGRTQRGRPVYRHVKTLVPPRGTFGASVADVPQSVKRASSRGPLAPQVSPDGRTRAVGTPEGAIELRDVRTDRLRAVLDSHGHPVRGLLFSPNGRALASWDTTHTIKLWDVGPPAVYGQWRGHGAAISPDETTLAVVDQANATVAFIDLKTGRKAGELKLTGLGGEDGRRPRRASIAYSPDGRVLAVRTWGCRQLYGRVAGEWRLLLNWDEHAQGRDPFHPDEFRLLPADNPLACWALLDFAVPRLADRMLFGTVTPDTVRRGKLLLRAAATRSPYYRPSSFSPSGRFCAVTHPDGWVRLWDIAVLERDQ